VFPISIITDAGDTTILVTGTLLTVIVAPPLTVGAATLVAVIVAVPGAIAVTTPLAFTDATAVLELVHVTDLFPAFAGFTSAVAVDVLPIVIDAGLSVTTILDGRIDDTCKLAVPLTPGAATLVAVIKTVPALIAVITPVVAFTVAIDVFELLHVTFLFPAFAGETSALACDVPPIDNELGLNVTKIPVGNTVFTVIVAFPVILEAATLVAVIIAVPGPTAVITPLELTVATAVLELLHVTDLSPAFAGDIVAVAVVVAPTEIVDDVRLTTIDVGNTEDTFNVADPETFGAATLVAVITAVPAATAVTRPLAFTVATAVLELLHVTDLSPALAGLTVAIAVDVPPTDNEFGVNVTVIPEGNTAFT